MCALFETRVANAFLHFPAQNASKCIKNAHINVKGPDSLVVRSSASGAVGRGFAPQSRHRSVVAWWLMPRTPDPEVGDSSPTRVKPCCVLEQGTFTPQKVLVIPRKRWLRPNMTEKMFTGTLRINQPTNQSRHTKGVKMVF